MLVLLPELRHGWFLLLLVVAFLLRRLPLRLRGGDVFPLLLHEFPSLLLRPGDGARARAKALAAANANASSASSFARSSIPGGINARARARRWPRCAARSVARRRRSPKPRGLSEDSGREFLLGVFLRVFLALVKLPRIIIIIHRGLLRGLAQRSGAAHQPLGAEPEEALERGVLHGRLGGRAPSGGCVERLERGTPRCRRRPERRRRGRRADRGDGQQRHRGDARDARGDAQRPRGGRGAGLRGAIPALYVHPGQELSDERGRGSPVGGGQRRKRAAPWVLRHKRNPIARPGPGGRARGVGIETRGGDGAWITRARHRSRTSRTSYAPSFQTPAAGAEPAARSRSVCGRSRELRVFSSEFKGGRMGGGKLINRRTRLDVLIGGARSGTPAKPGSISIGGSITFRDQATFPSFVSTPACPLALRRPRTSPFDAQSGSSERGRHGRCRACEKNKKKSFLAGVRTQVSRVKADSDRPLHYEERT